MTLSLIRFLKTIDRERPPDGMKYGQIIKMQVDPIAINQPPRIDILGKILKTQHLSYRIFSTTKYWVIRI